MGGTVRESESRRGWVARRLRGRVEGGGRWRGVATESESREVGGERPNKSESKQNEREAGNLNLISILIYNF